MLHKYVKEKKNKIEKVALYLNQKRKKGKVDGKETKKNGLKPSIKILSKKGIFS